MLVRGHRAADLRASFASHPIVTRLALNRLARAATAGIVARITGGKPLPEALLDEIAARTDGVPLFVEEMTKAVLESGALRETADAYHLDGPLSALAIPTTLHNSLMARLDRLHPVKEVAQTAAVIGRAFDHATIAALSALPEPELGDAMRRLVEAELVFRRGTPPDATYLFKHALVRDAAYESLLKAKRVALHARWSTCWNGAAMRRPRSRRSTAEAGRPDRAGARLLGAGRRAGPGAARPTGRRSPSLENAIRLCRRAGQRRRWRRREQGLHLQLGQALIANQGYQAAATLQAFERALRAGRRDRRRVLAAAGPVRAVGRPPHRRHGFGRASPRALRRAGRDAVRKPAPRLVGLRMLGLERFYEGRFAEVARAHEQALDIYDPIAHRDLAPSLRPRPARRSGLNYKAGTSGTWASPTRPLRRSRTICGGCARSTTPTRPASSSASAR